MNFPLLQPSESRILPQNHIKLEVNLDLGVILGVHAFFRKLLGPRLHPQCVRAVAARLAFLRHSIIPMATTTKKVNPRNRSVGPLVNRLTKSQLYSKKALYKRPHKPVASTRAPEKDLTVTKTVKVGGPKNGGQRLVPAHKAPKFYPSEDVHQPKKSRKTARPTKLRSTLTPGTVIIILAGRFRGKRAVFLKQLESGLLLVTGPFKISGVPLRRVNQAYVIATQTKVDLSGIKVDDKLNDSYFAKEKKTREQIAKAKEFFAENGEREKKKCPDSRIADQKAVDKPLIEAISKTANLTKYLTTTFGLSNGEYPHLMKF
ncbi:hypothetical protein O181_017727 [Austropuccinia psidii MF-1]|uniref:60S ribosomal protein L6 n=1 Tax=Austropuccinia psidii MF-1 TaxID=1389203 RepID=A0A9Q3C6F7_9BASI|nr:hypothetical protein [Austropuccinia psidii MF-1]